MKQIARLSCLIMFLMLLSCSGSKEKNADPGQLMTDQEILLSGDAQFNSGLFHDALQTYEKILLYHPTSDLHIAAQLRMAECYGAMENYESQMDALLRILKENIIPEQVPQIYVQIGKFYERSAAFNPGISTNDTSDMSTARNYYEKAFLYKDSQDQLSKSEAQYRRALTESRLGMISAATDHYNYLAQNDPYNTFGILARVKLMDPSNTSELKTDEASMLSYRQLLGDVESDQTKQKTDEPITKPSEQSPQLDETQTEQSIQDDMFDTSAQDTTENPANQ